MALASRRPTAAGLIHHSDRGVQYASGEYVLRLEQSGARISMAAVGNPYENAKAESFFRTLKMKEVYLKDYRGFEEAEENIAEFIEELYNRKRLHSSLGHLSPVVIRGHTCPEGAKLTMGAVRKMGFTPICIPLILRR